MSASIPDTTDDLLSLDDPVLTVAEAAKLLRVSEGFLGRQFVKGEIGGFRMGRRILIRKSDVTAYIARASAESPAGLKAKPEPSHLHIIRQSA